MDKVRNPNTQGGAAQPSSASPPQPFCLPGPSCDANSPSAQTRLKWRRWPVGPGACRAVFHGALSAKKNLSSEMPSAIFIYLSAPQPPPPVCQPGLAEPPSPSGHTSLLLTPVTTCPSLDLQHSLPEPLQSGLPAGTAAFSLVRQSTPTRVGAHQTGTGLGVSAPNHRQSWPPPPFSALGLGRTGLLSKPSTSRRLGPPGGVPTLQCPTNWSPWRDKTEGMG